MLNLHDMLVEAAMTFTDRYDAVCITECVLNITHEMRGNLDLDTLYQNLAGLDFELISGAIREMEKRGLLFSRTRCVCNTCNEKTGPYSDTDEHVTDCVACGVKFVASLITSTEYWATWMSPMLPTVEITRWNSRSLKCGVHEFIDRIRREGIVRIDKTNRAVAKRLLDDQVIVEILLPLKERRWFRLTDERDAACKTEP